MARRPLVLNLLRRERADHASCWFKYRSTQREAALEDGGRMRSTAIVKPFIITRMSSTMKLLKVSVPCRDKKDDSMLFSSTKPTGSDFTVSVSIKLFLEELSIPGLELLYNFEGLLDVLRL